MTKTDDLKTLTDSEVRVWITNCNYEPARQALRELLAYRVRGVANDLESYAQAIQSAREQGRAETAGTKAAVDVLAERERQKSAEGFTAEHDDGYTAGELSWAAISYATNAAVAAQMLHMGMDRRRVYDRASSCPVTETWPWDAQWWKPTGPRIDLVKAGALILAEIERLDRSSAQSPSKEGTDE